MGHRIIFDAYCSSDAPVCYHGTRGMFIRHGSAREKVSPDSKKKISNAICNSAEIDFLAGTFENHSRYNKQRQNNIIHI